jgi:hypothetical protein
MNGTEHGHMVGSDDLFSTLISGLDSEERSRTMELIKSRIIEDRVAAAEGRHERRVDTGTRSRSPSRPPAPLG